jgi:hypothetical protein
MEAAGSLLVITLSFVGIDRTFPAERSPDHASPLSRIEVEIPMATSCSIRTNLYL